MTDITIVNQSTVLTNAQIQAVLPAWQEWANTLVCPAYGLELVNLTFSDVPVPGWFLEVLDHADVQGTLGYHTNDQGLVSGKLFAADCLTDGVSWTVDGTHELGEMLVDPTADTLVNLINQQKTIKEICDAVEGDNLGITINGVLCSNFVLPAYWDGGAGPWDHQGELTSWVPTITQGGYISLYDGTQWTQRFAELADGTLADRVKRRTRVLGRHAWKRLNGNDQSA